MNHPDGPAERAAFLDEALAYDVDDYQAECDEADASNDVVDGAA